MEEKEREIRLQFLDEAGEYLDTLETVILGTAQRGIESQEINAALRAAHSIKGGAALMGYSLTSEIAHRLEDSLKVIKIHRADGVTSDIEGLLLSGVDSIRQIVERDRTSTPIEESWLEEAVLPLFDQLYDRLGEPDAEDVASMMDADEGQNVTPLIFQAEVEGFLERLEALLDEQPADFKSELVTMAQELSDLGGMLDLPAFTQLCQSVESYAAGSANAQQLQEVGQRALQVWRRSQALVVTGNADSMPTQLSDISFGIIDIEVDNGVHHTADSTLVEAADQPLPDTLKNDGLGFDFEQIPVDDETFGSENSDLVQNVFGDLGEADSDLVEDVFSGFDLNNDLSDSSDAQQAHSEEDAFAGVFGQEADTAGPHRSQSETAFSGNGRAAGTAFRFSEAAKSPQTDAADLEDNTVRVSVRRLNEMNDYFGELTIERNRLEAELQRMRGLVKTMGEKLRSLDELNDDVKDLYEQPQLLLGGAAPIGALPGSAVSFSPWSARAGTAPSPNQPAAVTDSSVSAPEAAPEFREAFDALEFDRYDEAHLPFRQIVERVVQLQEVADDIELSIDKTEQTTRIIHRTTRHLQRNLNQLRMRPLSDITSRFPRALREMELEHGKSVQLALEGEKTLIDRNILESLNDPLTHIVRNAFDHGIETPKQREAEGKESQGTIAIRAFNRSGRTVITVSDDGNGINLDKIRDRAQSMGLDAELLSEASESELLSLIFEPGFTTSDEVTSLSGRGVGMDVVRNNLTQIRGDISVDTRAGEGTTFTISVPYSLSVTRVMLAEANRMPVGIPTDMIEEVTVVDQANRYWSDNREMFHFKGNPVRIIKLSTWLAFNCPRQLDSLENSPNMNQPSVLIFKSGEQYMGLEIDRSWGEQEVAVRQIEGPIALPAGFSNCTILGDGRVVPLINLPDMARWVTNCEGSNVYSAEALYSNPATTGSLSGLTLDAGSSPEPRHQPRFMVIDDSVNVRRLLALTLEKQGYEVVQARDGRDALDKMEAGLRVDSIVCDVEMPRMDGYSLLSKVRSQPEYADIPVTMLTSRSGDKHRKLAMNLGATAYFSKPYQERVLLTSLADSLTAYLAGEDGEQTG